MYMDRKTSNSIRGNKRAHKEYNQKYAQWSIRTRTRVRTNASWSGQEAVLEQESNNGWETIAHASSFLNKAEVKYSISELELLGIVWSLEQFNNYLDGQYFTVHTDHRALLSILKDKSTKAHQSRLTRWCNRLILLAAPCDTRSMWWCSKLVIEKRFFKSQLYSMLDKGELQLTIWQSAH